MSERLNIYTELLAARDHLDAILSQVSPEDFPKPQTAHQRAKADMIRALYDGPPAILHRLQLERVNGQVARRSCLCGGWEWLGDAGPAAGDSFDRHLEEDRERRQHAARLVHVTVPQDGRPGLATWDKIQAAQVADLPPAAASAGTHLAGIYLDVPDTPEGRKLWQAHQDQFQDEEAEAARRVAEHAPFQPHTVRRASDLESGWSALVCSCGKWKGPRDAVAATVLNSYGAHLREVWGC